MVDETQQLKLENQFCFPLYAVSRLITQQYKPFLDELGVTYPQYLVLLVLWEHGELPIKAISERLFLETNTLTPLLKRMEVNGLVERNRSTVDERMVTISLASKGKALQQKAINIPSQLAQRLDCFSLQESEAIAVKAVLDKFLTNAKQNSKRNL